MMKKRIKYLGLFIFIVSIAITMAGCDLFVGEEAPEVDIKMIAGEISSKPVDYLNLRESEMKFTVQEGIQKGVIKFTTESQFEPIALVNGEIVDKVEFNNGEVELGIITYAEDEKLIVTVETFAGEQIEQFSITLEDVEPIMASDAEFLDEKGDFNLDTPRFGFFMSPFFESTICRDLEHNFYSYYSASAFLDLGLDELNAVVIHMLENSDDSFFVDAQIEYGYSSFADFLEYGSTDLQNDINDMHDFFEDARLYKVGNVCDEEGTLTGYELKYTIIDSDSNNTYGTKVVASEKQNQNITIAFESIRDEHHPDGPANHILIEWKGGITIGEIGIEDVKLIGDAGTEIIKAEASDGDNMLVIKLENGLEEDLVDVDDTVVIEFTNETLDFSGVKTGDQDLRIGLADGFPGHEFDVEIVYEDVVVTNAYRVTEEEEASFEITDFAAEFAAHDGEEAPEDLGDVTITVEETAGVAPENEEVTLVIVGDSEGEAFSETIDTVDIPAGGSGDFVFNMGEIIEADNYTATVTADADNADEVTDTESFELVEPEPLVFREERGLELSDTEFAQRLIDGSLVIINPGDTYYLEFVGEFDFGISGDGPFVIDKVEIHEDSDYEYRDDVIRDYPEAGDDHWEIDFAEWDKYEDIIAEEGRDLTFRLRDSNENKIAELTIESDQID